MKKKLALYADKSIIPSGLTHTFMLIPFFGDYKFDINDPDAGRFNELIDKGKDFFELVEDENQSDYFLLPFGYSFQKDHQEVINAYLARAKRFSKKTIIFYNSDDDSSINLENTIVFRTSLNKSAQGVHEYSLPGWSIDFRNYFNSSEQYWLPKANAPKISYCGYVDYIQRSLKDTMKSFVKGKKADAESNAKSLRGLACRTLLANQQIQTDFIIRNGFWAAGLEDKQMARIQYANNFIHSPYALVARGGGNFSYRMYEVLSCGRIPVFINTDSVLPFDSIIDWKKHVVWVEEKEVNRIDKILLTFHQNMSDSDLRKRQEANRNLYESYLKPLAFFEQICELLANEKL